MTLVAHWWRVVGARRREDETATLSMLPVCASIWRRLLSCIVMKALLALAGIVLSIQTACAVEAETRRPQDVARRAVEALLANDPQTLNTLIAPDRRRGGRPPGLALGFPEMTMLEDCRWTNLDRFVEAPGTSDDQVVVTAVFNTTCVAEHPWAVPTRSTLTIVLADIDSRWYVYDFR